ncbi:MAG: DedA family protein [Candidatus Doudnabacteria bacterium]|nr:DedA family protein [Candidatus Doudnabacteria bacterium]
MGYWFAKLLIYKYFIAFPLAIVEGPIIMVACGFLLRLGAFSFWPIYLALVLGDFVADIGWYFVGFYGARKFAVRWGKYFSVSPESLEKLEKIFEKHHDKILFISKITMGFGFALGTLIAAGMARVPLKKYALYNFFGGFIWTALLIGMGYFFGHLYTLIDKSFKIAFLVFLAFLLVAALYGAGKYFKNNVAKKYL